MDIEPAKNAELRVKHLEMIQGIVTRMAGQAAATKNYCMTLVTAVCGFAVTSHHPGMALLALVPILVFALLDARYLKLERCFRALFDQTRLEPWGTPPSFDLRLSSLVASPDQPTFGSWSVLGFYLPLAGGVLIVTFVSGAVNGTF